MQVTYYTIFDPTSNSDLCCKYIDPRREICSNYPQWLPQVELGLCLWEESYEGKQDVWLRWCDQAGNAFLQEQNELSREQQAKEAAEQRVERFGGSVTGARCQSR